MAFKTPIMVLQELVVAKGEAPPKYIFDSIGNQLNPVYQCTVTALSVTVSDTARNKKEAKQKAAAKAIQQIHGSNEILGESDDQNTSRTLKATPMLKDYVPMVIPSYYTEGINYIGLLNEYVARIRCSTLLTYADSLVTMDCFQVSCVFGTQETIGQGRTKKQAKQVAACEMLNELKQSKYIPSVGDIPKKEESIDPLSVIAMNKYKELSTSGVDNKKLDFEDPKLLEIEEKKYSMQEAADLLEKLNLNYRVEVVQKDPCLVVVHADGPIHVMGTGKNEESATEDAMNQTLCKLRVSGLNKNHEE